MMQPYLSVVAPCYNEELSLPEFHRRVATVCQRVGLPFEIVLVNDGSQDRTWEIMRLLSRMDPHLVCVNLARNHGHQLALTAGLSVCQGQRIMVIDADLQDPPELLPDMLQMMDEGVDVVYGQRRKRAGETWFKKASASLFYRVIASLASVPIPMETGDFRLMSRRVLEAFLSMPERNRFIRGMVSWIGFRQEPLLYDRDPRFAGKTKYTLAKMLSLATDALTGFSIKPLQWASYLGFFTCLVGLGCLTGAAATTVLGHGSSGLLLLMAFMGLLGGVQLLGMGILGEYLGRLYEQSKGRPLFLIDRIERQGQKYRLMTDVEDERALAA
jgi:glycosyltransferase involved in cell wall biosynthesis